QPGDSAGVADAIRARMAAGDTGTPASGGSAPGFGSGLGWIPWVGVIVVLGLVGGTLGATGAFGRPHALAPVSNTVLTSLTIDASVAGLDCPAGSPVTQVHPGQRVLSMSRSSDSAYIEVRDPAALDSAVWIPAKALKSNGVPFSTLPVSGCTTFTATPIPAPVVVTPVVPVTPVKPVKPGPPKDTTPPSVDKPTASLENQVCHVKVTATAADNVGVTSVSITYAGAHNHGSGQMTATGGHWEYVLNGTTDTLYGESTTFSVTAHDAAGNSSPSNSVTITIQCFG
ncbi:MAG: hypothetical protein ABJA11_01645, partial [Pseudolysinimonas sp.]